MPSKRKGRRKTRNYDINKRKEWRKLKKKPVIQCKQINDVWDKKKSTQQNLTDMGLVFDTNKAFRIRKTRPTMIPETPIIEPRVVKIPEVVESMEAEANLGEKEKRFLVSSEDVHFCTYMLDTYSENYKAMAKDRRNYYQLTPKQIRNKIRSFKRSKVQYKDYLEKTKGKQTAESESMETF